MNKSLGAWVVLACVVVTHSPMRADAVRFTFYEIGDLGCPVVVDEVNMILAPQEPLGDSDVRNAKFC